MGSDNKNFLFADLLLRKEKPFLKRLFQFNR